MNRMILILALALVLGAPAMAQDMTSVVSLAISSCQVTGNEYTVATWHPLIITTNTSVALIGKITVINRTPSVQQVVKFYEWGTIGTSSASVRCIWVESVGASLYTVTTTSTTVFHSVEPTKTISFTDRWLLKCKYGLAIQKSSPDSVVDVAVEYK